MNPRPSTQVLAPEKRTPERFVGKWRIVETEVWGEDALDLVVPAYIRFDDDDRMGYFQMIAISGSIDCRFDGDLVEFTWIGDDDGELTGGRGWAKIAKTGTLEGRIFIHQGDDSAFVAKRMGKLKR